MFSQDKYDDSLDPNEIGIGYLSELTNLSMTDYVKLKVPGDGNCGFYSLGINFINLIVQNKIQIPEDKYKILLGNSPQDKNDLIESVTQRIAFYKDNHFQGDGSYRVKLKACAIHMEKILNALQKGELNTFDQFKDFLFQNNSYHQVLAMMIFLAPFLRKLSVLLTSDENFKRINQHSEIGEITEVEPRENKDVEVVQLAVVAHYFNFSVYGYDSVGKIIYPQNDNQAQDLESNNEQKPDMNSVALVLSNLPGHWDCLLKESELKSAPYYFFFDETRLKETNLNGLDFESLKKIILFEKNEMNKFIQDVMTLSNKITNMQESNDRALGLQLIKLLKTHVNNLFSTNINGMPEEKKSAIEAVNTMIQAIRPIFKDDLAFVNVCMAVPRMTTSNEVVETNQNVPLINEEVNSPVSDSSIQVSPVSMLDIESQEVKTLKDKLLNSIKKLKEYGDKRKSQHSKGLKAITLANYLESEVNNFFKTNFSEKQYEDFKSQMLHRLDPTQQKDIKEIFTRRPKLKIIILNIALALITVGLAPALKVLLDKKHRFFGEKGKVTGKEKIQHIKSNLETKLPFKNK